MTCAPRSRRSAIGHDAMQGRKRKRVGDGPSDGAKNKVAMVDLSCSTARSRGWQPRRQADRGKVRRYRSRMTERGHRLDTCSSLKGLQTVR
jgi:hypothetical protein